MSRVVRRTLTHWSGPTVVAVLLALLSLPLVAISLDPVQAPPGVGAMNCRGGLFTGSCLYDGLPLADLGRWSAAAGAVLAAALISGTIGGWIVRRHAKIGGLLTVLLAWEVAIAAIPLLPATFHLDVAFAHAEGWMPLIRSTEPTSGLFAAVNPLYVLLSPFYEPVPFVLLLVGVVVWTKLLRRFPVSRSQGTPEAEAEIRPPEDDSGRSSTMSAAPDASSLGGHRDRPAPGAPRRSSTMSGFGWAGRLVAGLAAIALLGGCAAGAKWPTPTVAPTGSSWFVPTGSMTVPRVAHTATLLSDGRVLIAGGSGYGGNLVASAELYDPATGTFSPTGSMTTERDDHTATLLSDGRVLIVGGEGFEASASAELYDPKSGTFTATGSPVTARYSHTATLLADGRVLIAGGCIVIAANASSRPTGGLVLASAELYDPATGKFTGTGPMAAERYGHTATLLPDGRVLIAGGSKYDRSRVRRDASGAELYDQVTGAFSKTGSTTADRVGHTATLLTDGRVLIAGGNWTDGSVEVYNPKTGTFTRTGSMTTHPEFHTATLLSDGRVLIVGGKSYEASASAELYDPQAGTVTATGSPITARYSHTATLLSDGRVLIAGGSSYGGDLVASAELYRP